VVLVEVAPQLRTGGYVIDFGLVGYDIAEKVAKVASSALLILTAGWEVYRGWSKAKEEVRQREVALRELQGTARRATATAREQFLGRASCSVAKVLSPLIRHLTNELRTRGEQNTYQETRLARASELRRQLQWVIGELNARSQE
jgi:hypothetical protein